MRQPKFILAICAALLFSFFAPVQAAECDCDQIRPGLPGRRINGGSR